MSTEHPLPRVGQYVVSMYDLVQYLDLPAGETPVALSASSDGQSVRLLVSGGHLSESLWNAEPPVLWRDTVRVKQELDIEDGGPVFVRQAVPDSDEARAMDRLSPGRLLELVQRQVSA